MRNLKLLNSTLARLSSADIDNYVTHFTTDSLGGNIFIITSDNTLYGLNIKTNKELFSIPLESDNLLPPKSVVTGIKYVPDIESVCATTLNGEILLFNINTEEAELLGVLDSGIVSMAWSPDFELVIFATKNLTLKEMTLEWNDVTEVPIHPNFSEKENEEFSKELFESKRTIQVSWRGDGKVFAVNVPKPGFPTESILRVFDRECIYESTCETENVKNMENGNISWKPSGSLIACTQRLPQDRYDVIFFERNALRHGEFTIPDPCQVLSMQWNSSSDLLALLVQSSVDNQTAIQIWHMNNYHWYLKQELKFGVKGDSKAIVGFEWDMEDSLKLRTITFGGNIYELVFLWECDVTSALSNQNQCLISVIDGKNLLLTPMRRLVPPPPMSATSITLPSSVNQVIYSPVVKNDTEDGQHEFLVKLSNNEMVWCVPPPLPEYLAPTRKKGHKGLIGVGEAPDFDKAPSIKTTLLCSDLNLSDLSQLTWVTPNVLLALESQLDDKTEKQIDSIVELQIDEENHLLRLLRRSPLPFLPLRLYHNKTTQLVLIELQNAKVLQYKNSQLVDYFTLPSPCSTIATVTFTSSDPDDPSSEEVIVGLNSKLNRLYVQGFECSRECNSIGIHDRFLIFSTFNHTLRFIDLRNRFSESALETTQTHIHDSSQREVERGTRIVYAIPFDSKLILQMPRGNLEIIYPRALMLAYCRDLLSQHKYSEVFSQMLRHRIDLNLIYDHNPDDFIEHVADFIHQIESQNHLNLFLSSLVESDLTQSLFASREQQKKQSLLPNYLLEKEIAVGKIHRVCSSFRDVLCANSDPTENSHYLLTILTSLVVDSPPKLGDALLIIKELLHKEINNEGSTTRAESALEYVIFLVDVNKLYNVALSMYDLELAVMVAQKSSKDPKEYLPFLSNLNQMQEYYRKYSIDLLLERWESALTHLSESASDDDFQKCIQLIKSKSLYKKAIELYELKNVVVNENVDQHCGDRLKEVLKVYGEYLEELRNFEEAAQIYNRAKMTQNALECYKKSNNWRRALALAHSLKLSSDQIQSLATELSTTCYNLSLFKDAATILLEYCDDSEKAILCLIKGFQWSDAVRLSFKYSREDLIEEKLKVSLLEAYHSSLSIVQDKKATFKKQVDRLKVVKRTKILFPQTVQLPNNLALNNQSNNSMFSDTSSFASSMSSFSYVSISTGGTRRRKKQKRKRLTGKEGNPHEEEFLVQSLKNLIPSDVDQDEIHSLLLGLVELNFYNEASILQSEYSEFHNLVSSSLDVLLAPLIFLGGEDDEDDINHQKKIEEKNRMDMLYKAKDWKISTL